MNEQKTNNNQQQDDQQNQNKIRPGKRVHMLVTLGYIGTHYSGNQYNYENGNEKARNTIENKLQEALGKLGFDTDIHTLYFQRGSRTDKTVSACMQNTSFMIKYKEIDLVEELNKLLPKDIRVYGAMRVTPSFKCREDCTGRTYHYYIPIEVLTSNRIQNNIIYIDQLLNDIHQQIPDEDLALVKRQFDVMNIQKDLLDFWKNNNPNDVRQNDQLIEKLLVILQKAANTFYTTYANYFWNFTTGQDKLVRPSTIRKYENFDFSLITAENGSKFIKTYVKGNAFLYNQIRKMVGAIISVANLDVPTVIISRALTCKTEYKTQIVTAPGEYLILRSQQYGKYSKSNDMKNYGQLLNYRPEIQEKAEEFLKEIEKAIFQTDKSVIQLCDEMCERNIIRNEYTKEAIETLKQEVQNCKLIAQSRVTIDINQPK